MMLKIQDIKKQRGISLLEVLLSLSIIAIILVMATRYYKGAQQSQQVSNAVSMIGGIVTAETQYRAANSNTFGDLTKLTGGGYLPKNFKNDPWGNEIILTATAGGFTIGLGPMPTDTCTILAGMLNNASNATPTCTDGKLSATYQ